MRSAIFPNKLEEFFFYKTKEVNTVFFYMCGKYELTWTEFSAQQWSLSAKYSQYRLFAPKPYPKGVEWDFLFNRKFCFD